eukprot:42324_1
MMGIWLLHTFICVVYGASFFCDTELQCTHDIGSSSNDKVFGRGYKSLFQSQSPYADDRYCSAALSCLQTPYIIVSNQLVCYAAFSCSNISSIETFDRTSNIWSHGADALTNTSISCSATCDCYGVKSCAHSTISVVSKSCALGAHGALSLYGSIIYVINGSLTAELYAYYAGYQAFVYCKNESICDIECSDNGCDGLSLICDINSRCSITPTTDSVSVWSPNTNIILDTLDALAWNATTITKINEEKCAVQLIDKVFDDYPSDQTQLIYTTNVGPICCRAQEACQGTSIIYNATSSVVVCSGWRSCYRSSLISNSNSFSVECSAGQACTESSIITNGGSVYCSSSWSCYQAIITKMSFIYCSAYMSCSHATIISSGTDISVFFIGYQSGHFASVTCNQNDHCTIFCSSYEACGVRMNLTCHGTCFVKCSKNAICPDGWTVSPSSKPTSNPTLTTITPSFTPSNIPTTGAPTRYTLDPTVIPSIVPSEIPTLLPTTHSPTAIPTSEPTLEPTIIPSGEPTINPTVNPSKAPRVQPTSKPTIQPSPHLTVTYVDNEEAGASKSQQESLQSIVNAFPYANIAVIVPFSFIAITGFMDAKFLRMNDVFSITKIIQPLFQTLDAMSDVFLCYEVSVMYDYAQENQFVYLILLIFMAMFLFIPISFSIIQLATISNKYWINDKNESVFYVVNNAAIRVWFAKYVYFLYILSVLTGSSFSATSLFNSNLYGLSIFDMGLSESTLAHFKTKRIYSVIL